MRLTKGPSTSSVVSAAVPADPTPAEAAAAAAAGPKCRVPFLAYYCLYFVFSLKALGLPHLVPRMC